MNHASLFDYPLDECFLRGPNPVPFSSVLNRSILRETKAFNPFGVGVVLYGVQGGVEDVIYTFSVSRYPVIILVIVKSVPWRTCCYSRLCICKFCLSGFNQLGIENIWKKFQKVPQSKT